MARDATRRPQTVVLVDDSGEMRLITRITLERDGCAQVVGEAADGTRGLGLIHELRPDVAIVDIHMPNMDGITMVEHLRGATTQLVVYSSDARALGDALEAGAAAAVFKGDMPEALIEALDATRQSRRDAER
jgi:DNA-binding NarL/FixJ family response regulator